MHTPTLSLRTPWLVLALTLPAAALARGTCAQPEDAPAGPLIRAAGEAEAERCAAGLLSGEPGPRALAEARVQHADAPQLRALVAALRRRLEAALRPGELPREAAEAATGTRSVVTVRTWVVEATAERAQALVGGVTPGSDGLRRFDAAAFQALLRTVEAGDGLSRVTAPAVTTYLGQKATLSVEEQTAFVGDFELHEQSGRRIAEPVVEKVVHGLRLDVTPTLLGKALKLDVAVEETALVKPMATWTGTLLEGTREVSLQLPELKSTRWSRRVVVDPGVAVLLSGTGAEPGPGGKGMLVFVEARTP